MRAVLIEKYGGPEVLQLADVPAPEPEDDEILIDVEAAGINFADTHVVDQTYLNRPQGSRQLREWASSRSENSYLAPQELPLIPGGEVVGLARTGEHAGRRVVALLNGSGGYAEQAVAHASLVFPIDDGVPAGAALALILQGTTAWHLLRTSAVMREGDAVVVHAAAGGVGTLAVQLARLWGAGRVVATASSQDKRRLAVSLGADVAVDVSQTTIAPQVTVALKKANEGREVDVVLEMTGGHVFDGSLAALAPLGRLVTSGSASRTAPSPINPGMLLVKSRAVIGFWLVHALRRKGGLVPAMAELTSLVRVGRLNPVLGGTYPLADVARAHEDLLARRSVGKLVLDVAGTHR